jgi:hypothetical protein
MRIVTLIILFISLSVAGHSQAYEDKVQYDKKKQACIAIDYSYPPQAVENAIVEKFRVLGYKVKEEKGLFNSDKGFLIFKNAYVTDISRDRYDYIVKVERKSRKEKDEASLYLVMYKNEENALDKLEAVSVGRAKTFLNNMIPEIEAANLELQITDMEEQVAKSEKTLKNLQNEKLDLDKKIVDNGKNQDETIKTIDTQKKDLETLKGKRKK